MKKKEPLKKKINGMKKRVEEEMGKSVLKQREVKMNK